MALPSDDRRTKEQLPVITSTMRRLRTRRAAILPHPGPIAGEQKALGGKGGALRAAIFGVNDGLVSNVSLILGVAGAGVSSRAIVVAGIAGLLAGAFSMAAGEYISVRVQREVFERLIHLEAHELGTDPEGELKELEELYTRKGLPSELAAGLARELMRDPKVALETHAREELGLDPEEGLGSPLAAAGSSFGMFALGAIVPLVPFWFTEGTAAIATAAALSAVALFAVGAAMSYLTGRSALVSGLRMLAIGGTAAAVTYAVGSLLGVAVG